MFQLIKKDSGEGIVCAAGKGEIIVAPLSTDTGSAQSAPSENKKSCKAGCGSCGGCSSFISVDGGYVGRLRIRTENPQKYSPGDRVAFSRFILEPNLMSAIVFGIPVVLAIAALLIWFAYAPQSVESPAALITVSLAFFSGFFVVGGIDRIFKKRYPAMITGLCGHDNSGGRP